MRYEGLAYRAHDPAWAFSPLSGDGAAIYGARFNPAKIPALYLALSPVGALNEVSQGLAGRIAPVTLCEYEIDCEDIVDLLDAAERKRRSISEADMACDWATEAKTRGRVPPSWKIAEILIAAGAAGILVPSYAPGAEREHVNLVLWRWTARRPHRVRVFDPTGKLPKNQLSWPR